jgi:two-component system chemotaxis response regulator CheY
MPHVLIVDDSITTRLYYRTTLESAGFAVDEAINGLEGLEKTMLAPFDLLIVDVNMPKMDGLSFLAELRRREEARSTPAIVISNQGSAENRRRAHAAGANVYILKPVDARALVEYGRLMTGAPTAAGLS